MVAGFVLDLEAEDEIGEVFAGVGVVHREVAGGALAVLGSGGRQLFLPRLQVVGGQVAPLLPEVLLRLEGEASLQLRVFGELDRQART